MGQSRRFSDRLVWRDEAVLRMLNLTFVVSATIATGGVAMQNQKPINEIPRLEAARRSIAVRDGGYFPVLISMKDGRLGAVVRGGAPHLGIKGRLDWIESSDSGATWSAPRVIVDSEWDDRNPAVGQMRNGDIVVAYGECRAYNAQGQWDPKAGGFDLYTVVSKDGGRTWSPKRPLFKGPLGTGCSPYGRIVLLKDGSALMCVYGDVDPAYSGADKPAAGPGVDIAGTVRSRDNGATWSDFRLIAVGHNETGLLPLPDGRVLAAMRTLGGQVSVSESSDSGRTWTPARRLTGGPDGAWPQHPADMCRLRSGKLLMVCGNRHKPLGAMAYLSHDGAHSWDFVHRVSIGWTSQNTDCGYPSAVQVRDGTIVCLYYSVGTTGLPGAEQAISVRFTEAELLKAGGS